MSTHTEIVLKKASILTAALFISALPQASWAQTAINHGGIVSAATFTSGQALSAGGLVSIFGSNLAGQLAVADSVPLSTALAGVTVMMNGVPAPLDFVSSGQINAQIPYEVLPVGANGSINVIVNNNGAMSAPEPITINQFAPGVFTIPPGGGYSIAIIATNPSDTTRYGSIAAPAGAIPGFPTTPARPGDVLIVYATGLGPVTPTQVSGEPGYPPLHDTNTMPTALIGNAPAQVQFSGLTPQFPGVYQLNIAVPQVSAGNSVPLQIQMGTVTSPANAVIAVTAQ